MVLKMVVSLIYIVICISVSNCSTLHRVERDDEPLGLQDALDKMFNANSETDKNVNDVIDSEFMNNGANTSVSKPTNSENDDFNPAADNTAGLKDTADVDLNADIDAGFITAGNNNTAASIDSSSTGNNNNFVSAADTNSDISNSDNATFLIAENSSSFVDVKDTNSDAFHNISSGEDSQSIEAIRVSSTIGTSTTPFWTQNNDFSDEEDYDCFDIKYLDDSCSVPSSLEGIAFWDMYLLIFSDNVINGLYMNCQSGEWCLNSDPKYWYTLVENRAEEFGNANVSAVVCDRVTLDCLRVIADDSSQCAAYPRMNLVVKATELLCKLLSDGIRIQNCEIQVISALHVNMADLDRTDHDDDSEESEATDVCSTREALMAGTYSCVQRSCEGYLDVIGGFDEWQWFMKDMNMYAQVCDFRNRVSCVNITVSTKATSSLMDYTTESVDGFMEEIEEMIEDNEVQEKVATGDLEIISSSSTTSTEKFDGFMQEIEEMIEEDNEVQEKLATGDLEIISSSSTTSTESFDGFMQEIEEMIEDNEIQEKVATGDLEINSSSSTTSTESFPGIMEEIEEMIEEENEVQDEKVATGDLEIGSSSSTASSSSLNESKDFSNMGKVQENSFQPENENLPEESNQQLMTGEEAARKKASDVWVYQSDMRMVVGVAVAVVVTVCGLTVLGVICWRKRLRERSLKSGYEQLLSEENYED